jgi:hypothetical protein
MARKKIETPPEKIAAGSLPVMREVPVLTTPVYDLARALDIIHSQPSALDMPDDYNDRRPCRPISSASPWDYE